MDMNYMITQMGVLFLLMAIGYIASKMNVIDETVNRHISKMFTTVVLPCMVLDSMLAGRVTVSGKDALLFLLYSAAAFTVLLLLALPTKQLLRDTPGNSGIYRFMIAFPNVGFVGYPVVRAVYGEEGYFYLALYCIILNLTMFSAGIMFMSAGKGKIDVKRILLNRITMITVATFALFLAGFRLPSPLLETCATMTKIGVPSGMIVVGSSLGKIPLGKVFSQWRLYPVSVIRLLAAPVLTWLILSRFIQDQTVLGVFVICASLPTAAFCSILSLEYGADEVLASKGVFLTTLISLVTIPAVVFFLL